MVDTHSSPSPSRGVARSSASWGDGELSVGRDRGPVRGSPDRRSASTSLVLRQAGARRRSDGQAPGGSYRTRREGPRAAPRLGRTAFWADSSRGAQKRRPSRDDRSTTSEASKRSRIDQALVGARDRRSAGTPRSTSCGSTGSTPAQLVRWMGSRGRRSMPAARRSDPSGVRQRRRDRLGAIVELDAPRAPRLHVGLGGPRRRSSAPAAEYGRGGRSRVVAGRHPGSTSGTPACPTVERRGHAEGWDYFPGRLAGVTGPTG